MSFGVSTRQENKGIMKGPETVVQDCVSVDVSAQWGQNLSGNESVPTPARVTYMSCNVGGCVLSSFVSYSTGCLSSCSPSLPGIDFKVKTIEVDGKKVKLQVW